MNNLHKMGTQRDTNCIRHRKVKQWWRGRKKKKTEWEIRKQKTQCWEDEWQKIQGINWDGCNIYSKVRYKVRM